MPPRYDKNSEVSRMMQIIFYRNLRNTSFTCLRLFSHLACVDTQQKDHRVHRSSNILSSVQSFSPSIGCHFPPSGMTFLISIVSRNFGQARSCWLKHTLLAKSHSYSLKSNFAYGNPVSRTMGGLKGATPKPECNQTINI